MLEKSSKVVEGIIMWSDIIGIVWIIFIFYGVYNLIKLANQQDEKRNNIYIKTDEVKTWKDYLRENKDSRSATNTENTEEL